MPLTRREGLQLAGLVAAAGAVAALLRRHRPLGVDLGDSEAARMIAADHTSPSDGNPRGDVTLVVFSDYNCPACRTAHPAMKSAVARDGNVRLVYKDWPIFGEVSERAARVALASHAQGIYPAVHDRLMSGATQGDSALSAAVQAAGGDWAMLERFMNAHETALAAQLAHNAKQAYALGLTGTPGYLIGPLLVRGALSESDFVRAIGMARASVSAIEGRAA